MTWRDRGRRLALGLGMPLLRVRAEKATAAPCKYTNCSQVTLCIMWGDHCTKQIPWRRGLPWCMLPLLLLPLETWCMLPRLFWDQARSQRICSSWRPDRKMECRMLLSLRNKEMDLGYTRGLAVMAQQKLAGTEQGQGRGAGLMPRC